MWESTMPDRWESSVHRGPCSHSQLPQRFSFLCFFLPTPPPPCAFFKVTLRHLPPHPFSPEEASPSRNYDHGFEFNCSLPTSLLGQLLASLCLGFLTFDPCPTACLLDLVTDSRTWRWRKCRAFPEEKLSKQSRPTQSSLALHQSPQVCCHSQLPLRFSYPPHHVRLEPGVAMSWAFIAFPALCYVSPRNPKKKKQKQKQKNPRFSTCSPPPEPPLTFPRK